MSKKLYEEMTAGTMDDRSTPDEVTTSSQTIAKPNVGRRANKKYNVLTGLVHSYCKPYRTNVYWKALAALLWRKILFGRGYIIRS